MLNLTAVFFFFVLFSLGSVFRHLLQVAQTESERILLPPPNYTRAASFLWSKMTLDGPIFAADKELPTKYHLFTVFGGFQRDILARSINYSLMHLDANFLDAEPGKTVETF